jgi:iron complex transport system ATP-binding protein
MVELTGIVHEAGGRTILHDLSARLWAGRFHVIIGPNGAGQSTLLRIAAGLLRPTAGEVRYDGRPVRALPPDALARTRAVLSQHVTLPFPLPAEDVVLMGRYPHFGRVPTTRDRAIVTEAMELVGIADRRTQSYPTLSGGEQQKVQMARVLAQIWNDTGTGAPQAPRILFLDEPTSSLDVRYQLHLLDVARGLLARDCTVVAVLHDLNMALHYGDDFLVMAHGRLVLHADDASAVDGALLERVFRVRAHRVSDPVSGDALWRFEI